MELVNIFVKGVFIENMIFAYYLGMCDAINPFVILGWVLSIT